MVENRKNTKAGAVWDKMYQKEKSEEKKFDGPYNIVQDYSEYSTIQGIIYIFFGHQTNFGRFFWILVVISMLSLGGYWTGQAYTNWQNNLVLTTVATTGFSVKKIEFPAVTICGQGSNDDIIVSGFFQQFFQFLKRNNVKVTLTPIVAAHIINKDESLLTSLESTKLKTLLEYLQSTQFELFLNQTFTGIYPDDDILTLMRLMTSRQPDALLGAKVALEGGHNECSNSSGLSRTIRKRQALVTSPCEPGFVLDTTSGFCFMIIPRLNHFETAEDACESFDAELVQFEKDAQVSAFINLLKAGKMSLPAEAKGFFFLHALRNEDGDFEFKDAARAMADEFTLLKIQPDSETEYCVAAKFDSSSNLLSVYESNCNTANGTVCRMSKNENQDCSAPFVKKDALDFILDPALHHEQKKAVSSKKKYFKEMFKRLDQVKAYSGFFSSMWYTTLPCFDIKGVTSEKNGAKSLLKHCSWKGMTIPCSALFTTFPTDRGMCCSFNIDAAEQIFAGQTFPGLISSLDSQDKSNAFTNSELPKSYVDNAEPKVQPGQNKGLYLMLDAHSDLFSASSVDSDNEGFIGLIHPKGAFPFTMLEGFKIRPGYLNIVALSGTSLDAEEDIRPIDPVDRNCLFPDETEHMKVYQVYTQSNCIFECSIEYSKQRLRETTNASCIPWFYPSSDNQIEFCDPWQTIDFFRFMFDEIPDETCSKCLPDCSSTVYDPDVFSTPLRRCDSSNLGVSHLCNLDDTRMPQPPIFGRSVYSEYQKKAGSTPSFVLNAVTNSQRYHSSTIKGGDVFSTADQSYDAYEKDIALLQIYFKRSTVFQLGTQPTMTWIDFLSQVGGLLGLCIGISIVTVIELVWLCLRLGAQKLKLTRLII